MKTNTADAIYNCDGAVVLGAPEEERQLLQIVMDALETEPGLLRTTIDENVKTYLSGAMSQMSDVVCDIFKRFEAQYGYTYADYRPWVLNMSPDFLEYTKPLANIVSQESIADYFNKRISGYQVRDKNSMVVVYLDYPAEECACAIHPLVFVDTEKIRTDIQKALWFQVKVYNETLRDNNFKWIPSIEEEEAYRNKILLGNRLAQFILSDGKELYAE